MMSIELDAFSNRRLNSMAEWQAAIDAEGFDIRLDDSRAFEDLEGFLPAVMGGLNTGFECNHFEGQQLVDELNADGLDVGGPWTFALCFRFGGDKDECVCANMSAAAYIKATDGVLFVDVDGEAYPPAQALEQARKLADPASWAF